MNKIREILASAFRKEEALKKIQPKEQKDHSLKKICRCTGTSVRNGIGRGKEIPPKGNLLLGAIAGDIIGSVYEFRSFKETTFPLFSDSSGYTDDTVMTVANAEWLLSGDSLLGIMQDFGNRYPAGYGGMFWEWLHAYDPQPYNS